MIHYYREGKAGHPTFLLLHGTGGDEQSLIQIAEILDSEAGIVGLRGEINENGALRFFKRHAEGNFDIQDLEFRTDQLLEEVNVLINKYEIAKDDLIVIGYSNGANIGAHAMLERVDSLNKGILFHPMSLGVHSKGFSLLEKQVWLSYSEADPIVPKETFMELKSAFEDRDAKIEVLNTQTGHQLTYEEVEAAKNWLSQLKKT